MSNVKVNGNTYNDVTSVRLPLVDGSGYAVYEEGQSADGDAFLENMLAQTECGDLTNEELTHVNPAVFSYGKFGTLNFPNAVTTIGGTVTGITAKDLLMPNIIKCGKTMLKITGTITGTLDLRSYIAQRSDASSARDYASNPDLHFAFGVTVGTFRLDALNSYRGNMFSGCTITNLVWGGADLVADDIKSDLNSATAITNLYITDAIYDDVAALIADGTITKVTNLHKYSEWSDT